ncbi:hypothetical protein BJY24_002354 [Nocardia transvalensis]|uniref:Uncharacterized protein n=1 Tax=Nocardia transvalensis TaxID=37333 RepID=A0A7W9UHV5_9NOCA|nr:hypothetical protein [Nocardia transvalensis]MBB5913487.1 hypothetical protein [Nocardia transvalensis]
MRIDSDLLRSSVVRALAPACLVAALIVAPAVAAPAAHADTDYGGGCVLYPDDPQATIIALRDICTAEQQDQIFLDAPQGAVPNGITNGWVARPPVMEAVAPPFWIGKNFYTGPDGGRLMNRITGAGIEGFPANVYTAPSFLDGQPVWALDYAPSITPQIWDEIREVTPNVWFGYSWWRGAFQTTPLLTFVLTY